MWKKKKKRYCSITGLPPPSPLHCPPPPLLPSLSSYSKYPCILFCCASWQFTFYSPLLLHSVRSHCAHGLWRRNGTRYKVETSEFCFSKPEGRKRKWEEPKTKNLRETLNKSNGFEKSVAPPPPNMSIRPQGGQKSLEWTDQWCSVVRCLWEALSVMIGLRGATSIWKPPTVTEETWLILAAIPIDVW